MNVITNSATASRNKTKLIFLAMLAALPMSVALLRAAEPVKKDESKPADEIGRAHV